MRPPAWVMFLLSAAVGACGPAGHENPSAGIAEEPLRADPVAVQQYQAYPEAATGRFVALADFEDDVQPQAGRTQAEKFSVTPAGDDAALGFVVNITRTGVGALEVTLPPRAALVFHELPLHDFRQYRLLSMAVYARSWRDDFRVTLVTGAGEWTAPRALLREGWNTVAVDLARPAGRGGLDAGNVQAVRLEFTEAAAPVTFNLDDVLLIDNQREIAPLPSGMELHKEGLAYRLKLPGRTAPVSIAPDEHGLWRLGAIQPALALRAPAGPPGGDPLSPMGQRRIGQWLVLEHNAIRLRLVNTWYFPRRGGEWASGAIRRAVWNHTFYADGRRVTHLELNNAGGTSIDTVRVTPVKEAAWAAGGGLGASVDSPGGREVVRWAFTEATGDRADAQRRAFARPGRLRVLLGERGDPSDTNGFDASQGCYVLAAKSGNCRFVLEPASEDLPGAVVRIYPGAEGRWTGPVSINAAGKAVRDMVTLRDGSILFELRRWIRRPITVEVAGGWSP